MGRGGSRPFAHVPAVFVKANREYSGVGRALLALPREVVFPLALGDMIQNGTKRLGGVE